MPDRFRTIERCLAEFFRREGIAPTESGGDVYLGVCTSRNDSRRQGAEYITRVVVDADHSVKIVSLTDLARTLSEDACS